jgi:hypothetical protein
MGSRMTTLNRRNTVRGAEYRALRRVVTIAAVVALLYAGPASVAAARSTEPNISMNTMVAVGQATIAPHGSKDLGALPLKSCLSFDVALKPRDPRALNTFVDDVSTPGSPLYRHYLGKGQFASRFGPTESAIKAVAGAMVARGFHIDSLSSDGLVLRVAGTAKMLSSGLGAVTDRFRARGQTIVANMTAPRLPESIARFVEGIVGLDGFDVYSPPAAPLSTAEHTANRYEATRHVVGQPQPCAAATATHGATGPEIAAAYNLTPLYEAGDFGAGETIGLIELERYDINGIKVFQSCYHTHSSVRNITIHGGPTGRFYGEDQVDIEDLITLAPKAQIDVFLASGSDFLDLLDTIAAHYYVKAVSTSWGGCENGSSLTSYLSENTAFAVLAAQGQSMFAATGDGGSVECGTTTAPALGVWDPSSQPLVTGVGGTVLQGLGNQPFAAPAETAWSGGGGGISSIWDMPSSQLASDKGVINSYSSGSPCQAPAGQYCREVPDVSANAGVGYAMYADGASHPNEWLAVPGTSLATPTWAAIAILMDDSSVYCRAHPVGFLTPALYKLAASTPVDFNDITTGANNAGNPIAGGKYPATAGYDLASGLGTPNAAALARSLCRTPIPWSPPAIATSLKVTGSPVLSVVGKTLYSVFTSGGSLYYEAFNGDAWMRPTKIQPTSGTSPESRYSPAAFAVNGHLAVLWTNSPNGEVDMSSFSNGAWSPSTPIAGGTAQASAAPAAAPFDGAVFAVWRGTSNGAIDEATLSANGQWTPAGKLGPTSQYAPTVTYPGGIFLLVAWTSSKDHVSYATVSPFGLGPVHGLPATTKSSPALTVDGSRVYLAWRDSTTNRLDISSMISSELNTWTGESSVPGARAITAPELAVLGPTLTVAWNGTNGHAWYAGSDQLQ